MSISEKINALKIRIENNKPLQDYCALHFRKQLKVVNVFKTKKQITLDELPIVMITRPRVSREPFGNASKKEHSVYLYLGFQQTDIEKALDNSIEIEDLLEAAISSKTSIQGDAGMYVSPADSSNDEGMFHPTYFMLMEVIIKDR